jgi:hypothetical protein
VIRRDRSTQALCPGHTIAAAALAFGLMALEGEGMPGGVIFFIMMVAAFCISMHFWL